MRKNVGVLLSLVMAAVMLTGCGGQSSEKPAGNGTSGQTTQASAGKGDGVGSEGGKVMAYTIQKESGTLDSTMNNYITSSVALQNLFTDLMQIGPSGGLINGCAEKYEVSGDGLEYTFTLRDGLKWSDGSPPMAGDFEYTWKRTLAQDTASPDAWYLFYLKNGEAYNEGKTSTGDVGVEAEDDKTLKVTLEDPTAYFIDLAAVTACFPVKKDAVEGSEVWTKSADIYVSNGTLWLRGVNPQASYVLERNPGHIDTGAVKLDGVNTVFIESAEAAPSVYNVEGVDVMDNIIIQTQARSQHGGNDELRSYGLIGTCYYNSNCEKDYLSDTRMRKALAMSLNRDVINQSIVASGPESSYAFVPHGIPYEGSSEDYHITVGSPFTEDVEAAKALTEGTGYPGGEGYPTLTPTIRNNQEERGMTQATQAVWKENLGVNTEIITFEPKAYWDEQTADNFDIYYNGWIGDYPDPSTNPDCFLLQRSKAQCRWLNDQAEEYDSMTREARSFTDNKKRMELFGADEKLLMEKTPMLPLYYRSAQLLVKPGCESVIKACIGHVIFKCADRQQAQ